MAALLPSMRIKFSKAGERWGVSADAAGAVGLAASAGGAGGCCAASRFASRSSSSTTSLRNSPSAVKGRRSITRNASSCLWSDKVLFLSNLYRLQVYHGLPVSVAAAHSLAEIAMLL